MTTPERSVEEILKDLLEQHFPKGLCKERGEALLLIAEANIFITNLFKTERQKREEAVEAERERIKAIVHAMSWDAKNETPDAIRILKKLHDALTQPNNQK